MPSEWCMNVKRVYHRNSINNLLALNSTYYLYYKEYCTDTGLLISMYQCYLVRNVLSAAEPGFGNRQWRTEGAWGVQPPQIPKALQNRTKLKPIVKTVKNCWI